MMKKKEKIKNGVALDLVVGRCHKRAREVYLQEALTGRSLASHQRKNNNWKVRKMNGKLIKKTHGENNSTLVEIQILEV